MPKKILPPMNMVMLQPSRVKPRAGDVFVVNMQGRRWVAGRVVRTNVLPDWGGLNLLYFYRRHIATEAEAVAPFVPALLIPPQLTSDLGWRDGFFKTLCNAPLQAHEVLRRHVFQLSQGPLRMSADYYVDEDNKPTAPPVESEMQALSYFGMVSYGNIDDRLSEALGIPLVRDVRRGGGGGGAEPEASTETTEANRGGSAAEEANGEHADCCVTVYVPTIDMPEDLVDELEERLGRAVNAADAGTWEGHGTHLLKQMFDTRFVGPDRRRLVAAIAKGLEGFRHRLPAGWYVTSRVGLEGEERREAV